jgi:hypothetical protein
MKDQLTERGLPCNLDAERFILGSVLLDSEQYELIAGAISADDFSLEKHRRIFTRMGDLARRGEPIASALAKTDPPVLAKSDPAALLAAIPVGHCIFQALFL